MREYKFRAWDLVDKKMVYDFQSIVHRNSPHMGGGCRMSFRYSRKEDRNPPVTGQINSTRFIKMMLITTKRGVDIYENDYIKVGEAVFHIIYEDCSYRGGWWLTQAGILRTCQ